MPGWRRKQEVRGFAVKFLLISGITLMTAFGLALNWALTPVQPTSAAPDGTLRSSTVSRGEVQREYVRVSLPPGAGAREIARLLHRAGLIKHPIVFEVLVRARGVENRLIAGDYEIPVGRPMGDILAQLVEGRVATVTFTIPEGLTIAQIADVLDEKDFAKAEGFLAACRRLKLNGDLLDGDKVQPLEQMEGYLFPDTYRVARGIGVDDLVKIMFFRWQAEFGEARRNRAAELGMTVHQVMTLASIIEREAKKPEERALISAVFHNRLKAGMKLDADPTVLYAIGEPGGELTLEDLAVDSPYNTYKYPGLPPGPICNPGAACIDAALYPADTDYLYFVARPDGTHDFSVTLREHMAKKRKYQAHRS